jgi:lipid-binding SYLF domain-containing protein
MPPEKMGRCLARRGMLPLNLEWRNTMNWSNHLLKSFGCAALALMFSCAAVAADKRALAIEAADTVNAFYAKNMSHEELAQKAAGVLIFPRITKGGAGVGAEYGEGVLQIGGKTVDYYKLSGASVGATLGVSERSEIVLFMTPEALQRFMKSRVWTVGVDAEVAVVSKGAGGTYDNETLRKPIIGFVFDEKGLIADVSLAGTKISRLPA